MQLTPVLSFDSKGVGKDQLSVSDIVTGMSLVGADGVRREEDLTGSSDKTNALKVNIALSL